MARLVAATQVLLLLISIMSGVGAGVIVSAVRRNAGVPQDMVAFWCGFAVSCGGFVLTALISRVVTKRIAATYPTECWPELADRDFPGLTEPTFDFPHVIT